VLLCVLRSRAPPAAAADGNSDDDGGDGGGDGDSFSSGNSKFNTLHVDRNLQYKI